MIRPANECKVEYRERMRDGDGTVKVTDLIDTPAGLADKGRLFSKITLEPGCGIGYHEHSGERELFYILSGTAEYSDNGAARTIHAGDVAICPAGTGHSIANRGTETVELIALIVYE